MNSGVNWDGVSHFVEPLASHLPGVTTDLEARDAADRAAAVM